MSFKEHVQGIVDQVPGAVAGVVMGFDGIAIETHQVEDCGVDLSALLIEYSQAAQQIRRCTVELAKPGVVTELAISSAEYVTLMRPLTEQIFLGMFLRSSALIGKARFLMRMAAPALIKELV